MAKKKQTKQKLYSLTDLKEVPEMQHWGQVKDNLEGREGFLCMVFKTPDGSTVVDFCDACVPDKVHAPATKVDLEVIILPRPTLWQRFKSWFK